MAKNMTRKSIASVAAISLGLVGLSALPAQAALSSVTFAPLSGTNSNFLADAGFVLQVSGTGAGSAEDIEYLIEGAVKSDFKGGDSGVDFDTTTASLSTIDEESDLAGGATVATQSAEDNTSVIIPGENWGDAEKQLIWMEFDESEFSSARDITITAFRDDLTDDDEYEDGEAKLVSYTFTVHPASSLTPTLTTSDPGIGSSLTAESVVKFDAVNMASIVDDGVLGKVTYKLNGSNAGATSGANSNIADGDYDAAKGGFVVSSGSSTFAAGGVIVAQPFILDETTAGTGSTTEVGVSRVVSLGNQTTVGADYTGTSGGSTSDAIRSGSGSFSVFADIQAVNGFSPENRTVTWTIAEETTSSDLSGTISAGGQSLTDATSGVKDSIKVETLTSASGRATLNVTYSGLKAGDTFDIQGSTRTTDDDGTNNLTTEVKYEVVDAQYSTVIIDNYYGSDMLSVENGDTVSIDLMILDDFATPLQKNARVDYQIDAGAGAGSDINLKSSTTANGMVTVSWTDTNDSDQDDVLKFTDVDVANSSGTLTATGDSGTLLTVKSYKSLDTATRVVISADGDDTGSTLNTSSLSAVNERTSEADAGTYSEYITATVYGASGAALPGVPVTFSSEGLFFGAQDDGGTNDGEVEISSENSITLFTNGSGVAHVHYDSNKAGKFVISATSGTGSDSTSAGDVSFAAAAPSAGSSISFEGSDSTAVSGGTFQIVGTLTDKFGNPVEVTSSDTERVAFSYDGKGITLPSTLPTITDSKGQMKFSVLLGTNDTEDATVTMTYDPEGDGDLTGLDDVVVDYTVDVNPTASGVEYGTQTAWTVNQGDGTAKVYVKFPEIDGKLRILHQTGGSGSYDSIYSKTTTSETMDGLRIVEGVGTYVVRTIDLADGTNRIRVSVDGEDIEVNGKDRPARYNE